MTRDEVRAVIAIFGWLVLAFIAAAAALAALIWANGPTALLALLMYVALVGLALLTMRTADRKA